MDNPAMASVPVNNDYTMTMYDSTGKRYTLSPLPPNPFPNQCHPQNPNPKQPSNIQPCFPRPYCPAQTQPCMNWPNQFHTNCTLSGSMPSMRSQAAQVTPEKVFSNRSHTASQVVDGRYASTYQTTVCKLQPTSPTLISTEFPPQRRCVPRGHGNFEVGGTGSGDPAPTPAQVPNNFRGGLSWCDRGSVYLTQPSYECQHNNMFTRSLRKYPRISLERSSEIVERLISYTQAKNSVYNQGNQTEPSRSRSRSPTKTSKRFDSPPRSFRIDESPTRDGSRNSYYNNYDVRNLREISQMIRENVSRRNSPVRHTVRSRTSSPLRERGTEKKPTVVENTAQTLVNKETQVAADMVCREVCATPMDIERTVSPTVVEVEAAAICNHAGIFGQKSLRFSSRTPARDFNSSAQVRGSSSTTPVRGTSLRPLDRKPRLSCHRQRLRVVSSRRCLKRAPIPIFSTKCPSSRRLSKKLVTHKSCEANVQNTGVLQKYMQICPSITAIPQHSSTSDSAVVNTPTGIIDTRNSISDTGFIKSNEFNYHGYNTQAEDYTKEAVSSWLNNIPWKAYDFLGRPVEKDKIINYIVHRLLMISSEYNGEDVKKEILDIISDIPFHIPTENKLCFLKKRTEDLINKLNSVVLAKSVYNLPQNINQANARTVPENPRSLHKEIKDFVKTELRKSIVNYKLEIDSSKKKGVEVVLSDFLINCFESRDGSKEVQAFNNTILTLERTGHLSKFQAVKFVQMITENFKERFWTAANVSNNASNQNLSPIETHTESVEILNSIYEIKDPNDALSFETYTQKLYKIIDEWLTTIVSQIPQIRNIIYRNIIIRNLIQYIIDRRRYLEMSFSKPTTEKFELNYLKYQILRWVNKLLGGNNVAMLEKTSELMRKIKTVPVPGYTKNINLKKASTSTDPSSISERLKLDLFKSQNTVRSNVTLTVNVVQTVEQSTPGDQNLGPDKLMNQNNNNTTKEASSDESFDNFLKEWIENLASPQNSAEEKESMKVAIYNGVWKILAKLKLSPHTKNYPALYDEALEEEIDKLLTSTFSQTPELMSKKNKLKSQLIAKTKAMNESVKSSPRSENFRDIVRYKIEKEVTRIKHNDRKKDTINNFEELRIQTLLDQYLLYCRYLQEDPMKAETHRTKLMRSVQDFARELKAAYGQHNADINEESCVASIMQAMLGVPLPSQDTLHQEADEILLGFEIDTWISDLPLYGDDSPSEEIKRRRLRDNLARTLHSFEYDIVKGNGSAEKAALQEILLVLNNLPLIRDDSLNISFIAKELVNRIKNRRNKELQFNADKSMPITQLVNEIRPLPFPYTLPNISATFEPPGASTTYGYPGQDSLSQSIQQSTIQSANQSQKVGVSQGNTYQSMPVGLQRQSMTNSQIPSRSRNSQQRNSSSAASRREYEHNSTNLNESIPISQLVDAVKPLPSTPIRDRVNYTLPDFNETFEPSASTPYRQPPMDSPQGSRPVYYESTRTDSQMSTDYSAQGTPIQYYTIPESPQSYPQQRPSPKAVKVTRVLFNEDDEDISQCCKDEMPCCDVVLGKISLAESNMPQPTSENSQQRSIYRPQTPYTSVAQGPPEEHSYYSIPPSSRMPEMRSPQVDPYSSDLRQTSPKLVQQPNMNHPQNLDESVNISKLVKRFEARPRPATPIRERVRYTLPDISETFEPSASTPHRQLEKDSPQGSRPVYYESTRVESQMGADYLDQDTPQQYYTLPDASQSFQEQKMSLAPTSPNAQHQSVIMRQIPHSSGGQGAPLEDSYRTIPYSPQTQRPSLKKPYTHGDGIPKCCTDKMPCCDETLTGMQAQGSAFETKTSPGEIRPQRASSSFMDSRQNVNQLPDYPHSSKSDVSRSPRQKLQTNAPATGFYKSTDPEQMQRFARHSNTGVSFRQNMSQKQSQPPELWAALPPATPLPGPSSQRESPIYQGAQVYPRAPQPAWETFPTASPGAYPRSSYPRRPDFHSASPVSITWQGYQEGYQENPAFLPASPVGTTLPGYQLSSANKQEPFNRIQATARGHSQSCCQDEVCPNFFQQQHNIPGKPVFSSTPYNNQQGSAGIPRGTQLPRRWNSNDDDDDGKCKCLHMLRKLQSGYCPLGLLRAPMWYF